MSKPTIEELYEEYMKFDKETLARMLAIEKVMATPDFSNIPSPPCPQQPNPYTPTNPFPWMPIITYTTTTTTGNEEINR